jgi:hypothetical protein
MGRNGTNFEIRAEWMRERQSAVTPSVASMPAFAERHYTVAEIAALWNLSSDAVRKLFQDEPGILSLGRKTAPHKRRYVTLRIPESVVLRVHRQMRKI